MFEPNSNKPLALISDGQLYFYQLDQLGTPLSLTDSDNNLVWQANYTVFGKATLTVNKIDNPIRFQGQYYDSESGLHYNHFRYYDPQTGRFISQDPMGLLGGINHYQYAPNHINWIDPLGLCAKEEGSVGLLDGIVGTADLVVTGLLNTGVDIVAGGAGVVGKSLKNGAKVDGGVPERVDTVNRVTPESLGINAISQDQRLVSMWTDSMKHLSTAQTKSGDKYRAYLDAMSSGNVSKDAARSAYEEVAVQFRRRLKVAQHNGETFENFNFERIHHWNWPIGDFPADATNAKKLFPLSHDKHMDTHRAATIGPHPTNSPINPINIIEEPPQSVLPDSYFESN